MPEEKITKFCPRCRKHIPTIYYFKNKQRKDGLHGYCKKCHSAIVSRYSKTEKGKIMRRKISRKYRNTPNGKIKIKQYRESDIPYMKILARNYTRWAISTGKIPPIKTMKCKSCDRQANHYHHTCGYDFKNRLQVIPLCHSCHIKVHA